MLPRLAARPSLFGLAPGGVYPAAPVARGAVRSCRTVSPLPAGCLAALARAVCFLWHFPWGRPRRRLAGTVFPWSPDFPLSPCDDSGRPAVWQARDGRHRSLASRLFRRVVRQTAVCGTVHAVPAKDRLQSARLIPDCSGQLPSTPRRSCSASIRALCTSRHRAPAWFGTIPDRQSTPLLLRTGRVRAGTVPGRTHH